MLLALIAIIALEQIAKRLRLPPAAAPLLIGGRRSGQIHEALLHALEHDLDLQEMASRHARV